jgi:hypothetical protein
MECLFGNYWTHASNRIVTRSLSEEEGSPVMRASLSTSIGGKHQQLTTDAFLVSQYAYLQELRTSSVRPRLVERKSKRSNYSCCVISEDQMLPGCEVTLEIRGTRLSERDKGMANWNNPIGNAETLSVNLWLPVWS